MGRHTTNDTGDAEEDTSARRLSAVEEATGLPPGTIEAKFLCKLVAGWLEGEPGELARWMDAHFVFEGDAEEQAQIKSALFRLEARWRVEESLEAIGTLGWS